MRILAVLSVIWIGICAHSQHLPDSIPSIVYQWYPRYVTFLPQSKLDSVLAYAQTDIVPVIYKVNKYELHPNTQTDSIVSLINRIRRDYRVRIAYIWIGGSASPEGSVSWNKQLGHYRSQALANYLRKHTAIQDSLLRVENLGEDWSSVAWALQQKPEFPNQSKVLKIIQTEPDWTRRKIRIKALDQGRTWHALLHQLFPSFRNSRMVIVCHSENIKTIPVSPFPFIVPEAMYPPLPAIQIQVEPPQQEYRFLALKTNALFLAAGVANLGFEAELWKRWSIDIPVWYSPYDFTPTRKLRLLAIQPEIRRWIKKAGKGHFLGLHTHVAGFNIAINDHGRYQDPNHALWGLGVSYGYSRQLGKNKHWNIEFNIGAGFAEYSYDEYRNWENGPKVDSGSDWYWGITRAGISLSYRWFKERKKNN